MTQWGISVDTISRRYVLKSYSYSVCKNEDNGHKTETVTQQNIFFYGFFLFSVSSETFLVRRGRFSSLMESGGNSLHCSVSAFSTACLLVLIIYSKRFFVVSLNAA